MKYLKDYLHLEEWRDIPNIQFYQASNIGRIRSMDKPVKHNYGGIAVKKGKILSQELTEKGYLRTSLTLNGKFKSFKVHTLVAMAWHHNPLNKPTVNHKDTVKTNNCEWNLEWATSKEQVNHAIANNCRKDFSISANTINKIVSKTKKPIVFVRVDTAQRIPFSGISVGAYAHGLSQSAISHAINRGSIVTSKINKHKYKVSYERP